MNFLRKYIMVIFIVIWCFMIYSFSSQNGRESSSLSRGITKKLVILVKKVDQNGKINSYKFNRKLRKTAHFLNYMALSLIIFFSIKNLPLEKRILISLAIIFLIACADEYYQSFVPGREGRFKDVIIDFSGASLGMISVYIKTKLLKSKKVS